MNTLNDSYLLAHALELRLLLAVLVIGVSVAAIKVSLFVAGVAAPLLAKVKNLGASRLSTGAYSAVGAR